MLAPESEDVRLSNAITIARVAWNPRLHDPQLAEVAAPHQGADADRVGRARQAVPDGPRARLSARGIPGVDA